MTEKPLLPMNRRRFLKIGIASGAALTLGVYVGVGGEARKSGREVWPARPDAFTPNAWVRVGGDDSVTVRVHHTEMGQGIATALSMIVAEELDADWSRVGAEIAPAEAVYKNPEFGIQMTAGSTSVKTSWEPLREAGAAARHMLVAAAAARWGVTAGECSTQQGEVVHERTGRRIRYGALVEDAAKQPVPERVTLKNREQYRLVGKSIPRLDTPAKAHGRAEFGIDVRLPGLLHATVVHAPAFGACMEKFDAAEALRLPGVRKIAAIPSGVAVVADTFWQAKTAAEALKIQWEPNRKTEMTTSAIRARWETLVRTEGKNLFHQGDVENAFKDAAKTIEAVYEVPFQAHATPEPMNCTAHVQRDRCEVWAPTQNQDGAQEAAAHITGLGYDRVTVHTPFVGGGFGRRTAVDYVAEAVEISKMMKGPVKVIWTREEDMQNGFFRPASCALLKAGLDRQGRPLAWLHRIVGPDQLTYQLPNLVPTMLPYAVPRALRNVAGTLAGTVLPPLMRGKRAVEGAAPLCYDLENVTVEYVHDDPGVPLGFWRSVAFSQNIFFVESFMDEIAAATGRDPLELRLSLSQKNPRFKKVLEVACEKADWKKGPGGNLHQGIAAFDFHGTRIAVVAGIAIDERGRIRVPRVVCAADCGTVIHPRTIREQITSGIVFGLTATLKSRITLTDGKIDQSNFHDFRILRMNEVPDVQVHIVPGDYPPTGIGELAVPAIGPAVANAVFAATGKRIRHIPIFPEDLI